MGKILEFENVYLEVPDNYELDQEEQTSNELINIKNEEEIKTTRLSLEELQRKLEETQSLHL